MNKLQRFKLGAGAGLVTMLLGALMVLVPAGAGAASVVPEVLDGNPSCAAIGYDIEAKDDRSGVPGDSGSASKTVDGHTLAVDWEWNDDGTEISFATQAGSLPVSAVIVKQANGANVYRYDPAVHADSGLVDQQGDDEFSHITFCADFPVTGSLTVAKQVTGAAADVPAAGTLFSFTVACVSLGADVVLDAGDAAFDLADGGTKTISDIPVPSTCTVTETGDQGADSTTHAIGAGAAVDGAQASGVVIPADGTETVTFTNDFEPTYSVTIEKTNDADGDGTYTDDETTTPGADVPFQVVITNTGTGDLTVASLDDAWPGLEDALDLLGDGVLSCDDGEATSDLSVGDVIPAGASLTCTFTVEDYAPAAGGSLTNTVTLDTDETEPVDDTSVVRTPDPEPTYSVDLEKLNDADTDGEFDDFEVADAEGDDVEFEITIENTGTGDLTLTSLTDTFDGEVVDLLADVDLSCEAGDAPVTLAVGSVLPAGSTTVCTFTLVGYAPAAGETLENVVEIGTAETDPASDDSTVAVDEVLSESTGTVTLVKEVTGDPVTDWEFDFGGALGAVTLTDETDSVGPVPVDAGEHTIGEDVAALPTGWAFEEATCVDQDDAVVGEATADGSVDFTVAPDADVTCTFVNAYTAPEVVPVVQPPAVLGAQTVRTLPRTGDETRGLAGVGAFMVALGAALVVGSRRQFADR